MRNLLVSIMAVMLILTLISCSSGKVDSDADNHTDTEPVVTEELCKSEFMEYAFSVQYIRAGTHDREYPAVKIIRTTDELNLYLQEQTYMDEDLLNACKKYNDDYFENQLLLIVLLEEGSGSIRHEVESVGTVAENTVVEIKSIVPEVGTCDMAYWHILIEPEAGVKIDEEDVTVFLDGRDITEKLTNVYHAKGNANISLTLKEGWEYIIDDQEEHEEFSISIYPEGKETHKLTISYYNGFGVCGTGLKSEEGRIGKYKVYIGTYDNHALFDFITIQDTFGDYVIFNDGIDNWWSEYGQEAMEILSTLTVGEGFVSRSQAAQIAKDKADSDAEDPKVEFDYERSVWQVTLSGKNTTGEDTFIIDVHGNIIDIVE